LINAAEAGLKVQLLVMNTPEWAQKVPGHSCGPIREDQLDAFAEFLEATVARYSHKPYDVHHWELFNEPDVDPSLVLPDSGFGCWGDQDDVYYGGRYYARMLKHAYKAIKAADPNAQVILGGLLLDGPELPPATFLEGVLEGGGGEYFDILAFHAYTFFSPEHYNWGTLPGTHWIDRGGVVIGKTAFLQRILERYDYSKPIFLNEVGLAWTLPGPPSDEYRQGQADYLVKVHARGLALGLANVTWFGWRGPGWRHMALLEEDLSRTPAFYAYSTVITQLSSAEYIGPAGQEGIEGYLFRRDSDRLGVLWSKDGQVYEARFPSQQFLGATDLFGEPVPVQQAGSEVILSIRRPTYVEIQPQD
jgi:hypothetical protein